VRILNSDREEAERGQLGRIVVKLPLPPGNMSTLFRADDRFASVYFKEYPVLRAVQSLFDSITRISITTVVIFITCAPT
jgi:acyl-coenzyme A synthetase/AMP-(fatty) acid ligase